MIQSGNPVPWPTFISCMSLFESLDFKSGKFMFQCDLFKN